MCYGSHGFIFVVTWRMCVYGEGVCVFTEKCVFVEKVCGCVGWRRSVCACVWVRGLCMENFSTYGNKGDCDIKTACS